MLLLLLRLITKAAVNDQTTDLRYSAVGSKQTNKQTATGTLRFLRRKSLKSPKRFVE
jgi:hypothetical protein